MHWLFCLSAKENLALGHNCKVPSKCHTIHVPVTNMALDMEHNRFESYDVCSGFVTVWDTVC